MRSAFHGWSGPPCRCWGAAVRGPAFRKEEGICPRCGTTVESAFIRCPGCHHKLRGNCKLCGRLVHTDRKVCPYCETKINRE